MKNTGNIALILCIAFAIYLTTEKIAGSNDCKTGVVQMDKLIYDFKGMKEATEKYTAKMNSWSSQSDSLETRLKVLYEQIRIDSLNKDQAKLDKDIKAFMIFKQSYAGYMRNMQENADKEDKQMTIGVVNQVNEYIKEYAKANGYDLILCNSQQQSVGYAKEQVDITQKLLEFANNKYEGIK